jgi:hypothetical protein
MRLFRDWRYGSIRTNARRANSTQDVSDDDALCELGHESVPWDVQVDSLDSLLQQHRSPVAKALAFHSTWERWTKGIKHGSRSIWQSRPAPA